MNFFNINDNSILAKKVNLGLDLQGGSYLLLEVDSLPMINQNLQQKFISIKKYFNKSNIKYMNLKLSDQSIYFQLEIDDANKFEKFFLNKDNQYNFYYGKYRAYEMNIYNKKLRR